MCARRSIQARLMIICGLAALLRRCWSGRKRSPRPLPDQGRPRRTRPLRRRSGNLPAGPRPIGAGLAPGARSPTPGATVPSRPQRPVTTPSGRHGRCPVARAVIGAAAVFLVATSCTGTPTVIQPQGQASADPHVTHLESHVKPHRTFPPSPPAPSPSLVHGEITLIPGNSPIEGNSSTKTSIPLGTVVHLRLDSKFYDSPASNYPLVLAQTSPPPPGVLADFRAVGLGSANLWVHEVDPCTNCGRASNYLVFHITVRGS